jgi:hypothetical protein
MAENLRFVRIRGRIVPIRSKPGRAEAKKQIQQNESKARSAGTVSNVLSGASLGADFRGVNLIGQGKRLNNARMVQVGASFRRLSNPLLFAALGAGIYGYSKAKKGLDLRKGLVGDKRAIEDVKKDSKKHSDGLKGLAAFASVPLGYVGLRKAGPALAKAASAAGSAASKIFRRPVNVGRGPGAAVPRRLLTGK